MSRWWRHLVWVKLRKNCIATALFTCLGRVEVVRYHLSRLARNWLILVVLSFVKTFTTQKPRVAVGALGLGAKRFHKDGVEAVRVEDRLTFAYFRLIRIISGVT